MIITPRCFSVRPVSHDTRLRDPDPIRRLPVVMRADVASERPASSFSSTVNVRMTCQSTCSRAACYLYVYLFIYFWSCNVSDVRSAAQWAASFMSWRKQASPPSRHRGYIILSIHAACCSGFDATRVASSGFLKRRTCPCVAAEPRSLGRKVVVQRVDVSARSVACGGALINCSLQGGLCCPRLGPLESRARPPGSLTWCLLASPHLHSSRFCHLAFQEARLLYHPTWGMYYCGSKFP